MPISATEWNSLFARLVETELQIALVCTGGGAGAIATCFRRAGASRNFVEAVIPYSRAASAAYLGTTPQGSYASPEFARQLAACASQRAAGLSDSATPSAVGIALVAVMPTEPAGDAEERIHVAVHSAGERQCWSKSLPKGEQSRESAEGIADEMVFQALSHAARKR